MRAAPRRGGLLQWLDMPFSGAVNSRGVCAGVVESGEQAEAVVRANGQGNAGMRRSADETTVYSSTASLVQLQYHQPHS
jgi:hypothetical protein